MKKQETQADQIRRYVRQNGSITTMEAFFELGITKLATRISEMIRDGYTVKKTRVAYQLPSGKSVHIMKYSGIRKKRGGASC